MQLIRLFEALREVSRERGWVDMPVVYGYSLTEDADIKRLVNDLAEGTYNSVSFSVHTVMDGDKEYTFVQIE